jgi:hypothetical protein
MPIYRIWRCRALGGVVVWSCITVSTDMPIYLYLVIVKA